MADEPISGLTETTSVTGNEFIPIVQSGVTKKIKQINLVPNQASFSGTILFDSDITLSSGYIYKEKNTNSGSRSLTIPSATGNTGKFIFVAKQYNNGYNIACSGGGISSTLTRSNDSVLYICDGSSWQPHLNISNELLLAISGKEPTITAGTTSQYWRGDKTWQTFPTISTPSLDEVTDVGNTTTNDITVGSATLSNTTVSTLPFINTAKKIISATGALLGTWFQTLTADTNPVDADTIVVNDSASSFEAKKTTLFQLWSNYIKSKADAVYLLLTGGTLTGALNYAPSVTVASATTTDIGNANSNNIIISGTTTITSFGTVAEGVVKYVRFSGALTLTHNATSLILPNGSNITTQANDTAIFRSMGAGNWVCISYKSVTALAINNIPYWDGSKFVNSNFKLSNANSNIGYWDNLSNSAKFAFASYSGNAEVALMSAYNTINFYNYSASVQQALMTVSSSLFRLNFLTLLKITQGGSDGRQIAIDSTMNYYANNIHQFTNSSNINIASINSNGLAIGSSTINASAQLDLQSTTKGIGLNLVANGSKPTGRKGNFLMNDTNSVLEFTTGTGANWQELAVYKFDELLQITDCNATFSTANTGVYFPFVPKCDMNVVKIYYNLQSAGTDTVRVAIYSDSSNQATTLLVQGSESTTGATTTGQRSITISSTRLLAGTRYWIAIKNDSGVASFLSKNNVYSNNITREGFTSGAFVTTPAPSSSTNAVWLGIGI